MLVLASSPSPGLHETEIDNHGPLFFAMAAVFKLASFL